MISKIMSYFNSKDEKDNVVNNCKVELKGEYVMKKIINCLNGKKEKYKVVNDYYIELEEGHISYDFINKIYHVVILGDEEYLERDVNEVIEILLSY